MWPWTSAFNEGWLADWSNNDNSPVLTRATLAYALYNLAGEPAVSGSSPFKDVVDDTAYTNAIIWASQQGLITGYDNGKFGPGDPVTREQAAVILWRYAGKPASSEKLTASDTKEISSYAVTAMQWAVENSVLSEAKGALNPQGQVTCAQIAQMIYPLIPHQAH